MRHVCVLFVWSLCTVGVGVAQPKVAVLNALAAERIDQSVTGPVTEKVIERLVASGRYLVLDRANVQSVLKEREFQYSGLVSDAEVSQAGKYLGADQVVVIKIENLEGTYFVSARMIEVETGVILRQASAEGEGKLPVLLSLSERVGVTLAGTAVPAQSSPQATALSPQKPASSDPSARARALVTGSEDSPQSGGPSPAEAPQSKVAASPPAQAASPPVRASSTPQKTTMAERIGVRIYAGFTWEGTQEIDDEKIDATFRDFSLIVPLGGIFCLPMNLTYADGTDNGGYETVALDMGLGLALPLGIVMPWCAAKVGLLTLADKDYLGYGFSTEVGVDLRLGMLLLGVRHQVQSAKLENSQGTASFDLKSQATIFMAGLKF